MQQEHSLCLLLKNSLLCVPRARNRRSRVRMFMCVLLYFGYHLCVLRYVSTQEPLEGLIPFYTHILPVEATPEQQFLVSNISNNNVTDVRNSDIRNNSAPP
jgi:hypothetical protein